MRLSLSLSLTLSHSLSLSALVHVLLLLLLAVVVVLVMVIYVFGRVGAWVGVSCCVSAYQFMSNPILRKMTLKSVKICSYYLTVPVTENSLAKRI